MPETIEAGASLGVALLKAEHDAVDAQIKGWPDDIKAQVGDRAEYSPAERRERARALKADAEYFIGQQATRDQAAQRIHDKSRRHRVEQTIRLDDLKAQGGNPDERQYPYWAPDETQPTASEIAAVRRELNERADASGAVQGDVRARLQMASRL
jgi:hypothetical protein